MSERDDILANAVSHTKDQVRAAVREVRKELSDSVRQAASSKINEAVLEQNAIQRAEVIFCYIGYGSEVDTLPLIEQLLTLGKKVCVPKLGNAKGIVKPDAPMKVVELESTDVLKPSDQGILEPRKGKQFLGSPDVTITPCIAATQFGARLGQGGGYYDKYFDKNPLTIRIALAFECQILADLPGNDHDCVVDLVITENALYQRDEVAIDEDNLWEET
ncbi:5-formyltetrahydrofolate cyclo-ligase family protein [Poriferisphaera corsica]|uniref:5-formyltetrahydrofolate cyclo-ligase n=1 Tax=Poriferisphaera corsica TaxID=2528020 RepID=A0A517YXL7_9BACT|nr:5-formyltetrahydrofolate cyclo-ligase [Poriferisphaera corsica]QDU34970.1 5-formyltetrahydrofolate cyclo-ligase family protein [Poriferisphaera corsica]